ncbi:unnamed protein product, partial [marine sediment metagenome]
MKKKIKIYYRILIGLIFLLIISSIVLDLILIKELKELRKPRQLIEETSKACYMPRDCFKTEEEYLN